MRRILFFVAVLLAASALAPLLGYAKLPDRPDLPTEAAKPVSTDSPLDELTSAAIAEHQNQSGFRLVPDGMEAFALRAASARAAKRSLDIQYYIWHDDTTGRLLLRELVMAADRGVRVRLLLDDMDARNNNFALAGLDAHPNIEVRLFNPFSSRSGFFGKMLEMVFSLRRINHRMHNKSWIADNRIALAGGRNIGDEYFSASGHVNFFDLDYAFIGPAVQELSASFDAYWNTDAVYPIALLSPELVSKASLSNLLAESETIISADLNSPYIQALESSAQLDDIARSIIPFHWTADWKVLSDDPLKAQSKSDAMGTSHVLRGFTDALSKAEKNITLISPYFVPGKQGKAALIHAESRGRSVSVLTNSLAANDVAAVHGGYAKYRKDLAKGGVQLFELKPTAGADADISWFGSSAASLHTKAALIDDRNVFVGSFNLDPRSVSLNCEQGILAEHPQLAKEMRAMFNAVTDKRFAWEVAVDEGNNLIWTDDSGVSEREPKAGVSRKIQAFLSRILPFEAQL